MFDIGFQELTLIGVIALIVVGPERLPKMARTLGLWMGKIRFYVNQVKNDIDREVRAQELKEMLNKPAREFEDVYKVAEETKGALGEAKGALGEAKAALESTAAGATAPQEPAAGSILPPRPPDRGAESAPAGGDPAQPPASADPVHTVATETAEAQTGEQVATAVPATAGEDDEQTSGRT